MKQPIDKPNMRIFFKATLSRLQHIRFTMTLNQLRARPFCIDCVDETKIVFILKDWFSNFEDDFLSITHLSQLCTSH